MQPLHLKKNVGQTKCLPKKNYKHIFFYLNPKKIKLYWCYYPHRSRDSVSPECGIFIYILCFGKLT